MHVAGESCLDIENDPPAGEAAMNMDITGMYNLAWMHIAGEIAEQVDQCTGGDP